MFQLSASDATVWAGSLTELSGILTEELQLLGYCLNQAEVTNQIGKAVLFWLGYGRIEQQCQMQATDPPLQSEDIRLTPFEWKHLHRLARAYCDEVEGVRTEAAGTLGMQPYGISSGEARQNIERIEAETAKLAFDEGCFSVDGTEDDYADRVNDRAWRIGVNANIMPYWNWALVQSGWVLR